MMIYMTHPQHGAMHVYSEPEAVANEKNGWVRSNEQKEKIELVEPAVNSAPNQPILPDSPELLREEIAKLYSSKFGKKPHHKMSQKTIEAALKE